MGLPRPFRKEPHSKEKRQLSPTVKRDNRRARRRGKLTASKPCWPASKKKKGYPQSCKKGGHRREESKNLQQGHPKGKSKITKKKRVCREEGDGAFGEGKRLMCHENSKDVKYSEESTIH